jgi:predicted DCC family thiol-disulfide oxidoreductase YuxK
VQLGSVIYYQRDLNDVFRFVALQSKVGQEICNYIGVDPNKMDSIILYERTSLLLQIRSCFKIGSQLGFSIPCAVLKLYL